MEPIRIHRNTIIRRHSNSAGVTLTELLVVLAIITILTAIVFNNQSSFNRTIVLANTAYDIALTIRSVESFGLGSRAYDTKSNVGYGVYFDKSRGKEFTLFADIDPATPTSLTCHGVPDNGSGAPDAKPGDCVYTEGSDYKVNKYTLGNGIEISNFCVYHSTSGNECKNVGSGFDLNIVFARPNPDAFISKKNYSPSDSITKACIVISSPQGDKRYVLVTSSGQITASATDCTQQ